MLMLENISKTQYVFIVKTNLLLLVPFYCKGEVTPLCSSWWSNWKIAVVLVVVELDWKLNAAVRLRGRGVAVPPPGSSPWVGFARWGLVGLPPATRLVCVSWQRLLCVARWSVPIPFKGALFIYLEKLHFVLNPQEGPEVRLVLL